MTVSLVPVDAATWRACAELDVRHDQREFVAPVARYLALCAYDDGPWHPLAVVTDGAASGVAGSEGAGSERVVVGFAMEAVDPADDAYWIGGLIVDATSQGRGLGRATVLALVERARAGRHASVALSYAEANVVARGLYRSLGFVETGEHEGDELVARLAIA
jgi:diamine N-acetyltransferase